ncbi:hypothetical protein [Hymenobacter negativus]|uniref:Uncharacterized protein n=1 Tax=Hymenobacter negativus TaxID=2795026 RepID=A0ABS3QHI2_9BACT|nr:hypothetical protein [Hymenobacter negativus]MBO2010709.1 hypothetical protein [Hymenobacter negativus]
MKPALLLLLALPPEMPTAGPGPVRITFSPLTKPAYLEAKKSVVVTKPKMTFPLKKQNGQLTILTTKGPKIFKDIVVDEAANKSGIGEAETLIHDYLGYLPAFKCHLLRVNYYETSQYLLISDSGQQLELWGEPIFAPDMQHIIATCMGIEYGGGQPNILQLLALRNGVWKQVWKQEPKHWEPYRVGWTSANTLLLSRMMWTGKSQGTPILIRG